MRTVTGVRPVVPFLLCALLCAAMVSAQDGVEYHPVLGPEEVQLSGGIGSIAVPEGMAFLGKQETAKALSSGGEPVHGNEIGLLAPTAGNDDWAALITYNRIGYVKDEGADRLDSSQLLRGIRERTAEDNEERVRRGGTAIEVVGWDRPPRYDRATHTLTWSIVGRDSGTEVLNYSSVTLGRYGILSCTVVADAGNAEAMRSHLRMVSSSIAFAQKQDYAAWTRGDRVSDVTMGALITGGAGAAAYGAAKVGLLAKLGKLLLVGALALKKAFIVVLVAIWAAIRGFIRRLAGRRDAEQTSGGGEA